MRGSIQRLAAAEELAGLRDCLSPASFWQPEQLGPQPSWVEHAPFAFWLVEALRPRMIVELGTHGGFSYFAFCQAVQRLQLDGRCRAVDTWSGDEHAGFYGEEVYEAVRARNDRLYSTFSMLIRATFEEAVRKFDDASIDLLHIDGRHRLADVKHDFETWRPKLSDRAVVLFHDTNVHQADFGVWQYWAELSACHPHFEFLHGHGLGVLGIGRDGPVPVRRLFAAMNDEAARSHVREAYARLGSALSLQLASERQASEFARRAAAGDAAHAAGDSDPLRERTRRAEALLVERSEALDRLERDLAAARKREAQLQLALAERAADSARLQTDRSTLEREVADLRTSTSWRITSPLRWVRKLLG